MAQTILLFRINRDKYAVIQNVCRTLGIRIIDVARKDYSQKLGTLAQIQGFQDRGQQQADGGDFHFPGHCHLPGLPEGTV